MLLFLNISGKGQQVWTCFHSPTEPHISKLLRLLKPSRYFLYLRTEYSRTPRSAHSACLFCMISERTANFSPCTTLTDWFYNCGIEYVYCAVGIEFLYIFRLLLVFKSVKQTLKCFHFLRSSV